jgi:hypothetical protein
MDSPESHGATVLLAWEGKQDFAELIDYTAKLEAAGLLPYSGLLHQTWFSRNQSPYAHAVNLNLVANLGNLGDGSWAESGRFQGLVAAIPPPGELVVEV